MADRLTISINNFKLQYVLIDASGAYVNGIKITGTNVKLRNVTIYAPNGIAIDADESCEMTNCIAIGGAQDIDIATGKTVTSKNNCFQHHSDATDNIGAGTLSDSNSIFNQDPLLKDLVGEDYTLQALSPCIDKGLDIGLTEDINGNFVPLGKVDIGAYEIADKLIISINNFKLQYVLIDASDYTNGIKITGTNAKLYNVTIYAPNGIPVDADESCEMTNCILEGNTQDIDIATGKTVTSKNNCFQHHSDSSDNIGAGTLSDSNSLFGKDPLFKNPTGEDYSLQYGSPCIDKGLGIGLFRDINRNVVPLGMGVDIGAYEYGYGEGEAGSVFDLSPIFNFNFNFDF